MKFPAPLFHRIRKFAEPLSALPRTLSTEAGFAFHNALLWMILAARYPTMNPVRTDLRGAIFSATVILGHFAICALALFLLLAIFRPLPRPVRTASGVFVASAATALLLIDSAIYDLHKQHLDPSFVSMFFSPAGSEIFTFPKLMWVAIFGIAVVIIAAEFFLWKLSERIAEKKIPKRIRRATAALAALCFLAFNLLYAHAAFTGYSPVLLRAESFPGLQPLSARKLMRNLGFTQAERHEIPRDEGTLRYPLAPLILRDETETRTPNILFLFVDSWRGDALTPETMPRLHVRSHNALVFQNHISGGNATRCALFSAFYSLPATYWHSFFAARRRPVLMEIFEKKNYDFAIFASANLQNPEFDQTIFAGIKNLRLSSTGTDTVSRDASAARDFLSHMETRDRSRPWFGFLFYDALHAYALPPNPAMPFQPSAKTVNYLTLGNDTPRYPLLNLYKNSAFNLDLAIDGLLDTLEKRGDLENTIVIVTGDHGQEVNETKTNAWGHNSNYARWQIAVPLFILWPGKSPQTYAHRTTHWDFAPTLLRDVFGCANPERDYASGRNLFDPASRDGFIAASYGSMAVFHGESGVQVFKKYGVGARHHFDDLVRDAPPVPAPILRQAWDEMRRFRAGK